MCLADQQWDAPNCTSRRVMPRVALMDETTTEDVFSQQVPDVETFMRTSSRVTRRGDRRSGTNLMETMSVVVCCSRHLARTTPGGDDRKRGVAGSSSQSHADYGAIGCPQDVQNLVSPSDAPQFVQ